MRVVAFLGARCVWKIYFVNYDLVFQHWMISAKLGVVGSLSNIKELFTKGFATKRPTMQRRCAGIRGCRRNVKSSKKRSCKTKITCDQLFVRDGEHLEYVLFDKTNNTIIPIIL